MNLLEKVCKELGVEVGEKWWGSDGKVYSITDKRIIEYYEPKEYSSTDYEGWVVSENSVYADILQGKLKPAWRPREKDEYFYPYIDERCEDERFYSTYWTNHEVDIWRLENNLVFKTQEEAIACANKMLKSIKDSNRA